MIVTSRPETPVADISAPDAALVRKAAVIPTADVAVFLLLLALIVALQFASGAYRGEFSSYPDEPAHYVTSLMLRDYIVHFHFQSPMKFAEDYYHHYPKVAFGHWPPVFYILQSTWMILFTASRASVRLEIAFTAAVLAYLLFREARRWFGTSAAVLAGVLTVCIPLFQDYSDQEMAEALLTLFCFGSVLYFGRYAKSGRMRDSLLFGTFFALAVLTKGSGWLLALVPPIVLLLTRRWGLIFTRSFWASVVLVGITCVPWQIMTMSLAERGWDGGSKPSLGYTISSLVEFLGLFPKILGPLFVVFLIIGLWTAIVRPAWRNAVSGAAAAQFALLVSVWVFHSVVPAGVEDRKLVIAIPAMVLFVFAGGRAVADLVPKGNWFFKTRYALVSAVGAAAFLLTTFSIPKIPHYGFTEAARFLTARSDLRQATILVSSESGGEGLLISELAMDRPRPEAIVIRATKALASVAWNGVDYRSLYSNPEQVSQYLKREQVRLVVMDTYPAQSHFSHNALLRSALQRDSHISLLARFPSATSDRSQMPGQVEVYELHR